MEQRLNGEVLQDARTSDLIFTIPVLVSYISTLHHARARRHHPHRARPRGSASSATRRSRWPTATSVEVEIEGIGVLRNEVRAAT